MKKIYLLLISFSFISFGAFAQANVNQVTSTNNAYYKAGQVVSISVQFDQNVDFTPGTGSVQLALSDGGVATSTTTVSNNNTIVLTYTVGASDNAAPLDYASTAALTLTGTASIIKHGGTAVNLTLPPTGGASSLAHSNVTIDTTPPAQPTTPVLKSSDDTGSSSSDGVTMTNHNLHITGANGSVENGSTVTVYQGVTLLGTTVATGTGSYSYQDGTTYPDGTYPYTVTATDLAGNVSIVSSALSITVDTTPPSVSYGAPSALFANNAATITYTITYAGASTVSLTAGHVHLGTTGGASATINVTGTTATTATVQFTLFTNPSGTVFISQIDNHQALDLAGNQDNGIATPSTAINVDNVAPLVSSVNYQTPATSPTNASSVTFQVTFNESVTGVTGAQFTPTVSNLTNGSPTVSPVSGSVYNVTVPTIVASPPNGTLRLDVNMAGTTIQDLAGNAYASNFTTGQVYTIDQTAPTSSAAYTTNYIKSGTNQTITLTFSENLAVAPHITVTAPSGTPINNQTMTGATNSWSFGPQSTGWTGNGTATVTISTGADAAGNPVVSPPTNNTFVVDNIAPSVTINQDPGQSDPAFTLPVLFKVVFSEPVASFPAATVTVTAGTQTGEVVASGYPVQIAPNDGTIWQVGVNATGATGTIIATVPAGGVQDLAGNNNTVSTSADNTVTYTSEPSNPPTSLNFTAISQLGMSVGQAGGNGASYLIVANTSNVSGTFAPADGTDYSASINANFTSAPDMGGGDKILGYVASGSLPLVVSGMFPNTTYYFKVYSANGPQTAPNFNTTARTGNQATSTCVYPIQVTGVSVPALNITAGSARINWTRGSTSNALIVITQSNSPAVSKPVDGTSYVALANLSLPSAGTFGTDATVISAADGTGGGGANRNETVTGLLPSTTYTISVYEYNAITYCYTTPSVNVTFTTAAPAGEDTFAAGPGVEPATYTISAATTSTPGIFVFDFTVTDGGTDATDTKISGITITQDVTNNTVSNWTQAILGATLTDNNAAPNTQSVTTIGASSLAFTSMANGCSSGCSISQLGRIFDGSSKTYSLKIWLKPALGGTLPTTIDGLHIAFNVDNSSFAFAGGSSVLGANSPLSSGAATNVVDVVASAISFTKQPPAAATATIPFGVPNQPKLTAQDAFGNTDLTTITASVTAGALGPNSPPASFVNGFMDFSLANTFNYQNVGGPTAMTVTTTSPPSGLSVISAQATTVTATTTLGGPSVALPPATPLSLTNSTIGSISAGVGTNVVLGFNLVTTGSTLTLSQLVFTSSVSVTNLVQNFKLYSNSSDSFTGATLVAPGGSSATLTFSGLNVSLNGTPKYFFLVCDVDAYFPSLNPAISFSLPASGVNITVPGNIAGSLQTGPVCTLHDNTPPTLTSIAVDPTLLNAWSLSVNGTTPSLHGNTIDYIVTFSEPVSGLDAVTAMNTSPRDFNGIKTPSSYTGAYTTFSAYPIVNINANLGTPTPTGGAPAIQWVLTATYTGGTGTFEVDFNPAANAYTSLIVDVAGNPIATASLAGPSYTFALPQPTNPIAALTSPSITTTTVTVQWTNPVGGAQEATHYLVMAKPTSGGSYPAVADGGYVPNAVLAENVVKTGIAGSTQSFTFNALNSGTSYDFIIYPYTMSPLDSIANASTKTIDFNTTSPATVTAVTTIASAGTLTFNSSASSVSSLVNASNGTPVFTFNINEDGATPTVDNAPFKFKNLVVNPGATNNVANWQNAILGAQLTSTNGGTPINGTINPANITFTAIPATLATDLGFVADNASQPYTLRIWLKNPLGVADSSILDFNVNNSSFTYENTTNSQASSQLAPLQSVDAGSDRISVLATKLVVTTQPPSSIGLGANFPVAEVVQAQDANGNLDINFTHTGNITNTLALAQSIASQSFVGGVLTLSTLNFTTAGVNTQIKVTAPAGSVTSATSNNVTVVITNLTQITAGPGVEPATISSLTTAESGATLPQQNAVQNFDFTITDDVGATNANNDKLPTLISSIVINQGPSNDAVLVNWTKAIAGAELSDGVNVIGTGVIGNTTITFSSIANTLTTDLGYIADDGSKTYKLKIWLKNPVDPTIADIIDDKDFGFNIVNTNITLTAVPNTSSTLQTSNTNSGSANQVNVVATELDFTTQWAINAPQSYDAALSPIPAAKARDANGNVDIDYVAAASVTTSAPATYPLANSTVTNTNGQISFNAGLKVTSAGGGLNGGTTNLVLTSGALTTGNSNTFILNYSGSSDIIQDASFTYSTNILYSTASNQVANITGTPTPTNGIAVEQFILRDGGVSSPDADGTATKLSSITFQITNYQYLRQLALYDVTNGVQVAQLNVPANVTNVVGGTSPGATAKITFSGITFQAPDNGTNKLQLVASFNSANVVDNQTVLFQVTNVAAAGVSSSFLTTTPAGIQSTASGSQNRIEVVATQIVYTTIPASASVYVPIAVAVQAQDANGNLDINYNGTFSSFTTSPGPGTFITANNPSLPFVAGLLSFPATFQFTTGNGNVALVTNYNAGTAVGHTNAAAIAGTSPLINVLTSSESWMYFDPTFAYTTQIPFVNLQEAAPITTGAQSIYLGKIVLSDGGSPGSTVTASNPSPGTKNQPVGMHNDADGSFTEITDFTVSFTNFGDIRSVALFDSAGVKISTDKTPAATVTFTGLTAYPVKDNRAINFYIRASFNQTVADQDQIKMQITAVTYNSGSKFPATAGTVAGVAGAGGLGDSSDPTQNYLNVLATSLDFVYPVTPGPTATGPFTSGQPNAYAGINQPIDATTCSSTPYTGKVTARDKFANVDNGFNYTYSITATANPTLATQTAFANGQLDLTGMKYTAVGRGDLNITANGISSNTVSSGNSLPCTRVDVIDVGATYNSNAVATSTNLKGGTSPVIFGVNITPSNFVSTFQGDPANEPNLTSLTFSFSNANSFTTFPVAAIVPYQTSSYTSFTGFAVYESTNGQYTGALNVTTSFGAVVSPAKSVPASSNYDLVTVTFPTPRPLYTSGGQPTPTRTYFLVANVSPTATNTNPKLTPQVVDIGYGDNTIAISQGSSSADVVGKQFGFASTKPPSLVGATCTPYVGQLNVDPSIPEIDLTFDVPVLTYDGLAYLYDRSAPGVPIATLTALNGMYVAGGNKSLLTVNPLRFKIPTGTVLHPDSVYFVTIPQGTFNPTNNTGTGISDDQTNLYGGIAYNGTMYFKISSTKAPNMITTASSSYDVSPSVASLNASFDQKGTAYYLILDHSKYNTVTNKPTTAQIKNQATYSVPAAVITSGNFTITQLNPNLQYFSVVGNWSPLITYDVWVYTQNDAIPTPVATTQPYGSSASSFAIGGAGPTFSFTEPTNNGIPIYQLCPNSYSILSQPIIITETAANKWPVGTQDFNVLLPSGFDYDITYPPTVTLVGSDFSGTATTNFVNSTLMHITYTMANTVSIDRIVISNFRVIANSASAAGDIGPFGGSGLPDYARNTPPSGFAKISSNSLQQPVFSNSYTTYNGFNTVGSANNLKLSNVVTSIPDNYVDLSLPIGNNNAIRLIPNIDIAQTHDYNASFFSGSGVTDDILSLSTVAKNTAFDVTMTHTDQNGCALSFTTQYTVYDHTNIIPVLDNSNPLLITTQCLTNSNFNAPSDVPLGTASPSLLSVASLNDGDIAGYQLDSMVVKIPKQILSSSTIPTASSQIIFGPAWQAELDKILKPTNVSNYTNSPYPHFYRNYQWDYSYVLNAHNSNPAIPNPYDNFLQHSPANSNNYTGGNQPYYTGGSLGVVNFIGKFQSTADQTVYQPLVQQIELFVPAVPLIEVIGQSATIPSAPGPGIHTYVFCQQGNDIVFNGYPAASPGKSTGYYSLYDNATNTVLYNGVTGLPSGAGFTDNANSNGTATLKPNSPAFINGYKTIRVEYTYQDNNSPCPGTAVFYIQIAPNPIANFAFTSLPFGVNSKNASNPNAICIANQIDFDATPSTINGNNVTGALAAKYNYTWSFADGSAAVSGVGIYNPSHTFTKSLSYGVSLNLISDLNCPSIPQSVPQGSVVGSKVIQVVVGDTTSIDFSFTGSCVGVPIGFTDNSKLPNGSNSTLAEFKWDFGDGNGYTGFNVNNSSNPNNPFNYASSPDGQHLTAGNGAHPFATAKSWSVTLSVTTNLGCQNKYSKYVGILPISSPTQNSAFTEYFDGANGEPLNGGWITLDVDPNNPIPIPVPNASGLVGRSSWKYDAVNGNWSTTGAMDLQGNPTNTYYTNEKSALYSACLNLANIPRPVISFSTNVDLTTGEGFVLQYSTDNLNIQDPKKDWEPLGTITTGKSPGLSWYNQAALPSNPGTGYTNSHNSSGYGWTTPVPHSPINLIPKHKLDTINGSLVVLRFAFSSLLAGGNGITIDSIRVGSRTRTILFENFTTTNAPALTTDLLSDANYIATFTNAQINSTQIVNVNYHIGFLGSDPFNIANPADPSARALYYNVNQVPYAFLDGIHSRNTAVSKPDLFQNWGSNAYDLQTLNLAKADFQNAPNPITTVTPDNTNGTITADVYVTPLIDMPATTMLQIGLLEQSVALSQVSSNQVTTGETQFDYVLRRLIPNAAGTKFPSGTLKNGNPVHLGSYTWTADKPFGAGNQFAVVVFLQDEVSKEVYQSDLFQSIVPPTSTITAIEPITADNVKVYPNPADKEFTIVLPFAATQTTSIQLANQLGQFTEVGAFSEGEQTKTVSTQGLSAGVYILMLGNNGNAMRTKVVVLHK